jgi:hypothetical protein
MTDDEDYRQGPAAQVEREQGEQGNRLKIIGDVL